MKTIEEKARAYDEALEKAREYWETDNDNTLDIKAKGTMEHLFPELAESEDEKIMKEIAEFIYNSAFRPKDINKKEKWLTWFEKQGEQKPAEWSEDDEQYLLVCKNALRKYQITNKWDSDIISRWLDNKLKSLRPHINVTDKELGQARKDAYNEALDKIEYHDDWPTFDDGWDAAIWYLKKRNGIPQNRWKPTDGQMKALKEACDKSWEPDGLDPLYTLYEDLKKLKVD